MIEPLLSLFKLFRFFYGCFNMVSIHYIQFLFTNVYLVTSKVIPDVSKNSCPMLFVKSEGFSNEFKQLFFIIVNSNLFSTF